MPWPTPAQRRILSRCINADGNTKIERNEPRAADSLHVRRLGIYYPAEREFTINDAGRKVIADALLPKQYRDEPCEVCGALATTGVSGRRLCHTHTTEILKARRGQR